MSFSGLGVLISRPSPEKDSLLGPTVHEQLAHQILKKEGFFGSPFISMVLDRAWWRVPVEVARATSYLECVVVNGHVRQVERVKSV